MYIPKYHALTDVNAMHTHIQQHPLGAWVVATTEGLVANHIPFFLNQEPAPFGQLIGHVSRANPVWRQLADGQPCVVMFMGPQAYITPSWYPSKAMHGKVVPTWNYVTVHAHGTARAIQDTDWILQMVQQLTNAQESARPAPWQVTDVPGDFIEQKLRAIVGIEINIDRLEGRIKVSQDKEEADRAGVMQGLSQEPDSGSQAMANLVESAMK